MNNFSILSFFAKHKTAANLLMIFLVVSGLLSLQRLNRQLFPDLNVEIIIVSVFWPGASAEDVDKNIVQKLVEKLTVMACPEWTKSKNQPIDILNLSLINI